MKQIKKYCNLLKALPVAYFGRCSTKFTADKAFREYKSALELKK
jgi:hypothetical protein